MLLCCRYRYRDPHFLNALSSLVELVYSGSDVQKSLIPLSTLHMMTSSHSLFLPTMLDSDEEPSQYQAKGSAHETKITQQHAPSLECLFYYCMFCCHFRSVSVPSSLSGEKMPNSL